MSLTTRCFLLSFIICSLYSCRNAPPAPAHQQTLAVSWEPFLETRFEPNADNRTMNVVFSDSLNSLVGKRISLIGFMYPLQRTREHTHFVLAMNPASCGYCGGGGPESYLEVVSEVPVQFTYEPIKMSGVLEIDVRWREYMLFRMAKAQPEQLSPEELQPKPEHEQEQLEAAPLSDEDSLLIRQLLQTSPIKKKD